MIDEKKRVNREKKRKHRSEVKELNMTDDDRKRINEYYKKK